MGRRVSWVELYLDLVFVLAVAQLAHLIVAEPEMRSVWIALGLFCDAVVDLGGLRRPLQPPRRRRAAAAPRCSWPASVPAGVAAVAIEPASIGDSTAFALSLAVMRVVLARRKRRQARPGDLLRLRITRACLVSAALFVISVWAPEPLRYVLWAIGDRRSSRARCCPRTARPPGACGASTTSRR